MKRIIPARTWWQRAHRWGTATNNGHAWERWFLVWHVIFYASLLLASAFVVADPAMTWADRGIALGLSLVFAGWYWALVVQRGRWAEWSRTSVVYFAGALLLLMALTDIEPGYSLLATVLFIQVFMLWPLRWAIPGAVVLIAAAVWRDSTIERDVPHAFVVLANTVTLGFGIAFALFLNAIVEQSRDRQRLIDELEQTRQELARKERRAGILEERQRVAREIHDTVAQDFTGITLLLDAAELQIPEGHESLRRPIERARQTAQHGMVESRRLIWELRPQELEQATLGDAIRDIVARWSAETGISAAGTWGVEENLPTEVEITLLRIAQEALANVRKHASASQVSVELARRDNGITLAIRDNGAGFDPQAAQGMLARRDGSGVGLAGMRERVRQVGGHVEIRSRTGEGTRISVVIPVAAQAAETVVTAPIEEAPNPATG